MNTIVQHDIRPLFGLDHVPVPVYMDGFSEPGPMTPPKKEGYIWQRELVQDMMLFFKSNEPAMMLIGHTGTGKSSFVEQFHNRLNLWLYTVNCNPRTEADDLLGRFYPNSKGELEFVPGPLVRAALEGTSILLDEYNLLDPGEATGLNALLEGRGVYVPALGKMVMPQPGFRVFATINPKTVGYAGRNTQDLANDDRFVFTWVEYMPREQEISLLKSVLSSAGMRDDTTIRMFAERFRDVAETVRNSFMGNSDDAGALDITISTRSLVRWARSTVMCQPVSTKGFSAVHYALERAKTFKASPESRIAIHEMVNQVFGEEYKTPMTNPELLTNSAQQPAAAP